jgi:tRNA modification GTPase
MTTICASATPVGGAIAVIRISGSETFTLLSKVFTKDIHDAKGYTVHYGSIKNGDETVDEVLVTVFRAPHSYTGEDSAEISCHASAYIVREILNVLIANGATAAEPGEFTMRAFMNGKMDLSQAEAVADLIASANKASHDIAISQLRGGFSSELSMLREQLLKLTSLLELELDFSDHEELEFADRSELRALALNIDSRITSLAKSFELGKAIKEGIPVAIVGKTNVGKSTLLNRLLHEDKAIVSSIHGTTRDVIEDTTVINGCTFRFIDTAGIRKTADEIEQLGIERTFTKLHEARIVLWVVDSEPTKEELSEAQHLAEGKSLIVVRNKIDANPDCNNGSNTKQDNTLLYISAKNGIGIQELEAAIFAAADIPEIRQGDVIVTNARHYGILCRAHEEIQRVINSIELGYSGDLITEELHPLLHTLASITGGEISTPETLNNIFRHFCIGK